MLTKKRYIITDKINLLIFAFIILVNVFQFFLLPLYLLPANILWALILLPLAPFNNTMWFLIHEAIHKNLNSNNKLNELMGRVLSVFFGASFHGLTFGHMMHHTGNRNWESEFYNKNNKNAVLIKLKYFFNIFFGVYFTEVFGSLLLCFFKKDTVFRVARLHTGFNSQLQNQMENYFYKKDRIAKLKIDVSFSIILFSLSLIIYNQYWLAFLALIVLRAVSISFMDNIFHYGTPMDNSIPGKIVKANKLISLLILNSNYHGIHHSTPTIPWAFLPFEDIAQHNSTENFSESLLAQFNGPVIV